ncbi:MAG: vanadium-dependent haloperoxidase [Saprospiraceae bacterium]|nr:vanadium-dependent haloperoxidase [Saprospiraceae bacterium]
MKNSFYSSGFLGVLLLLVFVLSCRKDNDTIPVDSYKLTKSYGSEVPLSWNKLLIDIDRYSTGYRPPAAARLMGYVGMAAYESVKPGMPDYNSLSVKYTGLNLPSIEVQSNYHWPTSLNAAYAAMFRYFYPHINSSDYNKIEQLETSFSNQFQSEIHDAVFERSKKFGEEVAAQIYRFSTTDQFGHDAYKNPRPNTYIPPKIGANGEKLWQPTWPDYTPALFPYWGKVRTFALSQSELRGKPPLPYNEDPNSKFYQQALETRTIVNNVTFEDRWIAEFWSDDFFEVTFEPAARQIAIANQIVENENISLDRAVELYAKLGMSMSDAAIAVWNTKYIYNVIRPIAYIRDVMDPNWKTLLNHPYSGVKSITPEFPAYPSGHSCFGGSGAIVLSDIFGSNYSFVDYCHVNRFEFIGAPRAYNNFIEAGVENAYSRLQLGVHFRMDCDEGLRLGYLAAKRVIELPWKK